VASRLPRPLLRGGRGAAACGHPLAASVGIGVFRDGGGAVDAAIAAAAALAVLMPDACGLGGDAFMLVRRPGGAVTAINGSGAAGSDLRLPLDSEGPGLAAVPGFVAALDDAHQRFGRLPLERLFEPAVSLAGGGFPIGGGLLRDIAQSRELLERYAPGWPLLDTSLRTGALVRQPALAGLLQRIGRYRREAFYGGRMGRALERAVHGSIAVEDLGAHTSVVREPVSGSYRGLSLWLQPPVSQALLALMALQAIERRGASGAPGERAHLAVEAIEAAFAHRHEVVADGAEERLPSLELELDGERARRRGGPSGGLHTTGVATADSDGVVVSMLVSVFDDFGCGVLVPEGGFLLNSRLRGSSTDPGSPNYPQTGRRPVHTLSPSMLRDGECTCALATPGADGQVQTLVQAIDALADGEKLPRVLDRPRWRSSDGRLLIEEDYDAEALDELERRGHELVRLAPGAPAFGAVVAAGIDEATGTVFAASDPRGGAWAAAT
jgi:gamma-glutamyltranspeptidase/glutathione hydrolase